MVISLVVLYQQRRASSAGRVLACVSGTGARMDDFIMNAENEVQEYLLYHRILCLPFAVIKLI